MKSIFLKIISFYKNRFNLFVSIGGLILANIIYISARPYMNNSILELACQSVLCISFGFLSCGLIYKLIHECRNKQDKFLVKVILVSGEHTLLCNEQGYKEILEWHDSDEDLYIVKKPDGILRISKNNLVEISHERISPMRQVLEPILFMVKSPSCIKIGSYIKLLGISLLGILGYMYYNQIPFGQLLVKNSQSITWLFDTLVWVNIFFGAMLILEILRSFIKVIINRNNDRGNTYVLTKSFRFVNSIAFQGIWVIMFVNVLFELRSF